LTLLFPVERCNATPKRKCYISATPGNGSYVDFNNGTYGANTIIGSPSLYNTSPYSMGHAGYYSNFNWGRAALPETARITSTSKGTNAVF
jgi:hypothetical protein